VHKELGSGFQEVVYQRALALELDAAGLDFTRAENIPVYYKERQIDTRRVDFVVEDCVVEIKARKQFLPEDYVQTINYLKGSDFRLALLFNFGGPTLEIRRYVNDNRRRAVAEPIE
jgi:GxxExxY protein